MPVLPKQDLALIEFCQQHASVWGFDPAAVGLSSGQVAELAAAAAEARAVHDEAMDLRLKARSITARLREGQSQLRRRAGRLVAIVKAFAQNQASPGVVYGAAQIPAPMLGGGPALKPPGRPTDIRINLMGDGSVRLTWSAERSAASTGAFFTVSRRLPGETAYASIGGGPGSMRMSRADTGGISRRMSFTDFTLPAAAIAAGPVQYLITGHRGSRSGPVSRVVTVQIGVQLETSLDATAERGPRRRAA